MTVTPVHVEAAARRWLELLHVDLHYSLAEPEDGGPDQYPFEAANLFRLLATAANLDQQITGPAPVDVTVYELRCGNPDDRPEPVGLYATPYAAMNHGIDAFEAKHGANVYGLTWRPADDPGVWHLHVTDMDGASVVGDWHVVDITAAAAYTPAGGEQQ